MPQVDLPPLAVFASLDDYVPQYGDIVIWCGWFTSWIGVVSGHDREAKELHIVFSGVPYVLFTLQPEEHAENTRRIPLAKIKGAARGVWAFQQHDAQRNTIVWYI